MLSASHGVKRPCWLSKGIASVVSAVMTLVVGQETVPGMLISVVTVTPVAVLLPALPHPMEAASNFISSKLTRHIR